MTTGQRRRVVTHLLAAFPVSARHACHLVGLSRSRWHHQPTRSTYAELRARLKALAAARPRWGYQRLHLVLRREGYRVNHKLVLRLYREEHLAVRQRRRQKQVAAVRVPRPAPAAANERWSMDFVADAVADGRRFRCFTLVDDCTREALAIEVAGGLPALRVIQVLERVAAERSTLPASIVCDNGPSRSPCDAGQPAEFAGRALDQWAHARAVALAFIRPGKPVENAYIESFNGKFRDECLNAEWFRTLAEAQATIERWRLDYNPRRPHTSLGGLTPTEFARTGPRTPPSLSHSPHRLTA